MKTVFVTLPVLAIILIARAADPLSGSFSPTKVSSSTSPGPVPEGMVWIPGGEFSMGADGTVNGVSCCSPGTIADTLPIHRVSVDGFWMDATEVTNAQFAKFVDATG